MATPGLYESLGIDELRGSDTVTISFETSKFELGDIYSIATPKIIDSADKSRSKDASRAKYRGATRDADNRNDTANK